KRKLNLAISLIHEPELLLLDEPTVGIDLRSKKEIATYLKELVIDKKLIMIYISHDMDEIKQLCNKIYSLGDDSYYEALLKNEGLFVVNLSKEGGFELELIQTENFLIDKDKHAKRIMKFENAQFI